MDQRLSLITLIVDDVLQTRHFFEEGLGWALNATPSPEVAFYQMPGCVFALYDRAALSKEIGRPVTESPTGAMTIAWNAPNEAEVDAAFEKAVSAGALAVKRPETAFWGGYSSYVEIPGGHLMEIAYNPFWTISDKGETVLPEPA